MHLTVKCWKKCWLGFELQLSDISTNHAQTKPKIFSNIHEQTAAIAQWVRLRLTCYVPGFESKEHKLCFSQFIFELCNL